jgi:hypothetical protein
VENVFLRVYDVLLVSDGFDLTIHPPIGKSIYSRSSLVTTGPTM